MSNGEIIVVYTRKPSAPEAEAFLECAVLRTDGVWEREIEIGATSTLEASQDGPAVAFSAQDNTVHVAYRSDELTCDQCDPLFLTYGDLPVREIFYSRSTDFGRHWTTPVVLSDDEDLVQAPGCPLPCEAQARHPSLAVDTSGNVWLIWENLRDRMNFPRAVEDTIDLAGYCNCDDIYTVQECCIGGEGADQAEMWGRVLEFGESEWSDFFQISYSMSDYLAVCEDGECLGLVCDDAIPSIVAALGRVLPGQSGNIHFSFRTDSYSFCNIVDGTKAFNIRTSPNFCQPNQPCSLCKKYPCGTIKEGEVDCIEPSSGCTGNHADGCAYKVGVWSGGASIDWWGSGLTGGTDVRVEFRLLEKTDPAGDTCALVHQNIPRSYTYNPDLPQRKFNSGTARMALLPGSGEIWTFYPDETPYGFAPGSSDPNGSDIYIRKWEDGGWDKQPDVYVVSRTPLARLDHNDDSDDPEPIADNMGWVHLFYGRTPGPILGESCGDPEECVMFAPYWERNHPDCLVSDWQDGSQINYVTHSTGDADTAWGWEIPISEGVYDSKWPSVALGEDGLHVVWTQYGEVGGTPNADVKYRYGEFLASSVPPSETMTWSGVVFLDQDFRIPSGSTLEVLAGTVVYIQSDYDAADVGIDESLVEIIVEGTLDLLGTAAAPVVFRPTGDVGDSEWYGIRIAQNATLNLEEQNAENEIRGARAGIAYDRGSFPDLGELASKVNLSGSQVDISFERDVTIGHGSTQTIPAGWRIGFLDDDLANSGQGDGVDHERVELLVEGTLDVQGIPSDRVVFKSTATEPAFDDWYGLRFQTYCHSGTGYGYVGGLGRIESADIENAQYGVALENECPPSLVDLAFSLKGDGTDIHVLLDSTDAIVPYEGEWSLTAPTRVVARNVTRTGGDYPTGTPGKVDLIAHGQLNTTGSDGNLVQFTPQHPTDSDANDWGGIFLDWPSAGSQMEYAEINHAPYPVTMYWPTELTSIRHSNVHHFREAAIWVHEAFAEGAVVDSNTIWRGTGLDDDHGNTGILLEKSAPMLVRGNNVTLTGTMTGAGGAGIRILNGYEYCLEGPATPDSVQIVENTVTGPGQTYSDRWSGLQFDWACGPVERLVYVADNRCYQWGKFGMDFLQSSDVQVSCNILTANRTAVNFSRNTKPVGSGVRFRQNDFDDIIYAVFISDNALMLKLGPDVVNKKGRNRLDIPAEAAYFILENDPDSTDIMNAQVNRWLIGSVGTTDTNEILGKINTEIEDPARVAVDSPLGTWSPCSGQGQGETGIVQGAREEIVDGERGGLRQEGVVGLRVDAAPLVTGLGRTVPNPTEGLTEIWFSIGEEEQGWMTLEIFDVRGRLVKILTQQDVEPGHYRVYWTGRDDEGRQLAAGVYFVRLRSGDSVETRKVVLLR